jgi:hypothetical protein
MRPEIVEPTQYRAMEPSEPPTAMYRYFCNAPLPALQLTAFAGRFLGKRGAVSRENLETFQRKADRCLREEIGSPALENCL